MYKAAVLCLSLCTFLAADSFDNQALEDMKNYKAEVTAKSSSASSKEEVKKPSKLRQFFKDPSSIFRQNNAPSKESTPIDKATNNIQSPNIESTPTLIPTLANPALLNQSIATPALDSPNLSAPSEVLKSQSKDVKDSKVPSKYREYVNSKEKHTIFTIGSISIEELNGNYIMPFYYNFLPQYARYLQQNEAKIQLSFKVALVRNFLWTGGALYFNYTQKFFFQFYNFQYSAPIRDIDFQPELMYNYPLDVKFLGGALSDVGVSLTHLSNGEGKGYRTQGGEVIDFNRPFRDPPPTGPDVIGSASKSSNRAVFHAVWHNDNLRVQLKGWAPLMQRRTNPDLYDYLGYGRLDIAYRNNRNIFEASIIGLGAKKANYIGSFQLAYTFKLNDRVGLYFQYYYGYMDSLYEYNFIVNRVGVGFRFIR
ncbi:hypothetical protein BKH43_06185 [Helicobacter sp. 13S00401-1]|uniref:phospholipase A n=1 Tax=Helicobacter sp. 13S00401-1 TaxID=1905758 RepID=UPI000BA7B9BC|nr:phospholipase A [Helicobacter sp. 13S00401-1]PAF50079.1 hypothetical protein BKH43_06185 [Helicobacter sp. 13S00401-1]